MTIPPRRTAPSRVLLTALLAAGIALSGCSSPAQPSAADTSGSTAATTETSSPSTAFPIIVNSLYGDLTISEPPTRIVALTYQVADILASLGVQPIAVAMSQEDIALSRPWLAGQLTGTLDPDLVTTDYAVNIEKVLSYQPDLVVGDSWQIPDQSVYDTLSVVAPTYAGAERGNVDWDKQTIALATLMGQPDRATTVIAEVNEMFEASRSKLAALEGRTYHYARFAALPAAQAGRTIWADIKLAYATNGPGPLSLAYVNEVVTPILSAAAGTTE